MEDLCACLLSIDLENEELVLDLSLVQEVVSRGEHCLLTKLLSTRYYNKEAFKTTMRKAWRITKPIKFHDMGEGLMVVEFEDKCDKNKLLRDGPWNFDHCLLLTLEYNGKLQTKNIHITEASFWIRVYDLPLMA